jgi:hypothetical protein
MKNAGSSDCNYFELLLPSKETSFLRLPSAVSIILPGATIGNLMQRV